MPQEYSKKDVIKMIHSHPKYGHVKGSYAIYINGEGYPSFRCSETDFHHFVSEIIDAAISLNNVSTSGAPKEWAPLPGKNKEDILARFQEAPHVYKDFLREDAHIVVIHRFQMKEKYHLAEVGSIDYPFSHDKLSL